ncbi:MAG: anaerobic ribonucleoside-triphosphate reductase activating protein [Candidatus Cloacimonetes bacterium]|nr:anaerobic ribonucleoside-triphosphate reductase activating protein [Candidatus Cloacimonadota bacterium]MCF7813092.1 anaerobic ribonucleoside-triphosphate reductase activating protein [Candidatus Cloacimonadota bacterium]MCF7867541.1 anaerobic ribonucleoside-triphosphate reductase activating protein [Candidatus Cloacimonadota bacterium]MCF7883065.1 anaerobic ribonucleoside-triphosphate reductase activating protein [Candidatus Cloacimonadota bacterium]
MKIGGFQKFSLIDYPGKICAIVFTQGCNFRCPYCHNPELVEADKFCNPIPEEEIINFLENRKGKLDAVSITGGEPTLHSDLINFLLECRSMGFSIKLDTNGTNPDILEKIIRLKLVDYLAMDIKAPLPKYAEVTCSNVDSKSIKRSIKLIENSNIDYEFRSTLVQNLLTTDDVLIMGQMLGKAKRYLLQKFVPSKTLNEDYVKFSSFSQENLNFLARELQTNFADFAIR